MRALELFRMGDCAGKPVSKISGGQKQRAAVARAIVNDPPVILADEPTGAMNPGTAAEITDGSRGLNSQGKTVIIVTHDMAAAQQYSRIIEIADGNPAASYANIFWLHLILRTVQPSVFSCRIRYG